MKTILFGLMAALFALAITPPLRAQTADPRNQFTVAGAGIPGSLTTPTSDQGKLLNRSLTVNTLVIANTSGSSQTITVQDCQATPFILFNAYPIAATTTWIVNLNGVRFSGCIKWSASATTVMGTIVGQ